MNKELKAKEIRFLLQKLLGDKTATLSDSEKMQFANIYPKWQPTKDKYIVGDIVGYGLNSFGETQLWTVIQEHKSQESWTPESATSLFKKIGFAEDNTPIWTQPLGAVDAYAKGDIVSFNGKKYKSTIDNNVWSPAAYPAGWEEVKK